MKIRPTVFLAAWVTGLALSAADAPAADLTAREVTQQLFEANAETPLDFSNKNLSDLDLSGVDFKRARLAGSDMFGANLSGANLADSDLKAARLDRIIMIGVRFDRADLSGCSILRPTTTYSLDRSSGEASSFVEANLKGATLFGLLNRFDFSRANMEGITLAPFNDTGFIEALYRTEMIGAKLSGANLKGANLSYVTFRFADLRGANLAGAKMTFADLSGADLTGADLSGADMTNADLDGANLSSVKGLDTAIGAVRNRDKAIE